MPTNRPIALVLALLLASSFAAADELLLTNKARLRGGIHRNDATGVAYNPYFSRNPGMVFDVEVFPQKEVKEVRLTERPFQEFLRRMKEISDADTEGLLALADWCKEEKLKEERGLALLRILARDPEHEAALKAFGRSKFKPLVRGNPDLDPAVRAAIDAYLQIRDPDERKAAHGRLKREASVSLSRHHLDRIIRAKDQKTGREDDRALTFGTADSPGVYTIFVPKEYDPRRAWPLVLGLHGGGPGGKERDAVVGSGSSAMNFYVQEAAARGYIVVCPTAHSAGWGSRDNLELIRSVLTEVELLYHIDLNRVYLTGHSMGGYGAWSVGEQMAELFAAVSPMAGGGRAWNRLVETSTPLFIFHGADDGVVGPGNDRSAARALVKTNHDFIYTELAGVGHGFPPSIRKDLFDFFDVRRLAEVRGRRARPPSALVRSSFAVKVGKDEIRYLGDPTLYGETGGETVVRPR